MRERRRCAVFLVWCLAAPAVYAQNAVPDRMPASDAACRPAGEGFDNIQIETSDISLHERFFEHVLHAAVVQRLDHPLTDHIRIYCYRAVAVVVRQDVRTPHPTGWVQLNFTIDNVAAVQQELESAARALSEDERSKIARFRMKPGVMRGHRKVDRLEVYGPEGFLIGFDQPHPEQPQ